MIPGRAWERGIDSLPCACRLEYGRTGLYVELPGDRVVRKLAYKDAPPLVEPAADLRRVLERPNGTSALAELARGRKSACILICDITRPVPNRLILSPMLETLEAAGIPRDAITILIATGLHRPNLGNELVEMVGASSSIIIASRTITAPCSTNTRILAKARAACRSGSTSRYVEADLKITTGLIEPHLMAGFSGGRKLDLPRHSGPGNRQGLARARFSGTSQRRLRLPRWQSRA